MTDTTGIMNGGWAGKTVSALNWLPLVMLPATALPLRHHLPPWAFMWTLALAVYAACKWFTWRTAQRQEGDAGWRSVAYLLAWPGMDARSFLSSQNKVDRPPLVEWFIAAFKAGLGAVLIWGLVGLVPHDRPMLAGWIGMLGLILLLHFGLFHLLALFWRNLGVDARPIMNTPLRATSLTDFWANRWNVAFHKLAENLVFQPLHRRIGISAAMMATFAASGLIHDFVISLPAGAGYGLPTAYFVVQGLGVLVQRSRLAKRANLNAGIRGWLFTALFTAGPAYWLFHPPFIHNVIVPFMRAVGAL